MALSFDSFQQQNILIVGDVMIDRYLTGRVSRISPEAPVPVVELQREELRLGGAANVALNVRALGATPYLCSVIGKDAYGTALLNLLPPQQLSPRCILQSEDRRTTCKSRVIAGDQHLLRIDEEDTFELSAKDSERLLSAIRRLLDSRDIDLILFQDYDKGVLSKEVIREVLLEAVKRDIPTAVDPKKRQFWEYRQVRMFKPNLKEVRESVPFSVEVDTASLSRAADHIRSQLNNEITLITLSEKGLFVRDETTTELIPTQPRAIADVCGAGDTVFSVAALAMAAGLPLRELGILANLAGGQVCEKIGVVPVDRSLLLEEFQLQKH